MRVLFFGDSITDANRTRDNDVAMTSKGSGYVRDVASDLKVIDPLGIEVINRGISGNRVVDLYARVKMDLWNLNPDVISILIGVNDVWHEVAHQNGVELDRFIKVYKMLIEDTRKALPNAKIILMEPFVLKCAATEERYDEFLAVKDYAKAVKELAKEYCLDFLPLQDRLDEAASKYGEKECLMDGVHPNMLGARIIADEWLKLFKSKFLG